MSRGNGSWFTCIGIQFACIGIHGDVSIHRGIGFHKGIGIHKDVYIHKGISFHKGIGIQMILVFILVYLLIKVAKTTFTLPNQFSTKQ